MQRERNTGLNTADADSANRKQWELYQQQLKSNHQQSDTVLPCSTDLIIKTSV